MNLSIAKRKELASLSSQMSSHQARQTLDDGQVLCSTALILETTLLLSRHQAKKSTNAPAADSKPTRR